MFHLICVLTLLVNLTFQVVAQPAFSTIWTYRAGGVVPVAISSDGHYVVAGSSGTNDASPSIIYFLSRESGSPLWNYEANDRIFSVSTSSDGQFAAATTEMTGRILLFNRAGVLLWSYAPTGNTYASTVAMDPSGKFVALDNSFAVYIFAVSTGTLLWSQTRSYGSSSGDPFRVSIIGQDVVAPDYNKLVFYGQGGQPHWVFTGAKDTITSAVISNDGAYIAAGADTNDARVYFFRRDSGVPLWSFQTSGRVWSLGVSTGGQYVVAGDFDGSIYLLDQQGSLLWAYKTGGVVRSVSITPDGQHILAGSEDGWVYLFGPPSSVPVWRYQTGDKVFSVAASSDGRYLATGSAGQVFLFGESSNVRSAEFSSTTSLPTLQTVPVEGTKVSVLVGVALGLLVSVPLVIFRFRRLR
jgi:outer membrane protein assembly factor BamB